jgi:hypothetical protein
VSGQSKQRHHLRILQIEGVTQAAKNVVISHKGTVMGVGLQEGALIPVIETAETHYHPDKNTACASVQKANPYELIVFDYY